MDKLSERLWIMRVSLDNLTDDELATFDEAIEKAKRYEDAPVVHDATGRHGFLGQRVRIIREEAGGEG